MVAEIQGTNYLHDSGQAAFPMKGRYYTNWGRIVQIMVFYPLMCYFLLALKHSLYFNTIILNIFYVPVITYFPLNRE